MLFEVRQEHLTFVCHHTKKNIRPTGGKCLLCYGLPISTNNNNNNNNNKTVVIKLHLAETKDE
jgi:hypothetical protein